MAIFKVIPDAERPMHAGAYGMYQIMALFKDGEDVTARIDQGMMFHEEDEENEELTKYLSQTFGIPRENVEYEYNDPEDHPDWPFK